MNSFGKNSFGTTNTTGFGSNTGRTTTGFGNSTSTGFGSSTSGGFGNKTSGGFGSSTSSGFGSSTGKSTWGTGTSSGFGQQTKVQQAEVIQEDEIFKRIWKMLNSYNKESPSYKFCYIFYNKLGQSYPTCPNNILEQDWINICKEAPDPDHLAPFPVYGFKELHDRAENQVSIGNDLTERMKLIQTKLREMSSFYSTELQGSFEKMRQNTNTINQLLMEVVEIEDVLHQWPELNQTEEEMSQLLKKRQLDEPRLKSKIEELKNKAKRNLQNRTANNLSIDKNSLPSITKILECNYKALNTLESAAKKLEKQVSTLQTVVADKSTIHT